MTDYDHNLEKRKDEHLQINLEEDVTSQVIAGFDRLKFENNALPEIDLAEINLESQFLGKQIKVPLLISSMTGGTDQGDRINIHLAEAAEQAGIPLGVGSQRASIQNTNKPLSNFIRKYAKSIPVFANLGAIQLNNGFNINECERAINLVEADALILHLNPLQEGLQPEGQTNFRGLLEKIEQICTKIKIPVVVKEVGWGISVSVAQKLINAGVSCIDVAGAGGTSWSQVEKFRIQNESRARISEHFRDWGIPTTQAIIDVRKSFPNIALIASGGLRNGIDLAKCIALGANLGGMAGGLLRAASISSDAVFEQINEIMIELRITMFAIGANNLKQLALSPLQKSKG
jgi:isopentenyl-diphosphate delta-isomerase